MLTLHLPPVINVRRKPQAILRTIVGHISAQGVNRYLKGPLTEKVRDYLLDTSKPFPSGLHAYYWAYPYKPHVMFRDAAYLDIPFVYALEMHINQRENCPQKIGTSEFGFT